MQKNEKEAEKRTQDTPPHPDVQTLSKKEPQKEKADNSSFVPSQSEKSLGTLEKDVKPIKGFYREVRNPHERPRKTLVD